MSDLLPEDPDRDLLLAAREGDGDAFEALVRRHQGRVVGLIRTLTGRADDAEDLAQEVFVRVYRSLAKFRGDSLFRTWLSRVAVNVTRTHGARKAREAPVWQDAGGDEDGVFDTPDTANAEATWIARDAISRALERLPADLRVAVTLRDIHGLEYRDIAAATGAPIGTVESRIFRARQRLRLALAPLSSR